MAIAEIETTKAVVELEAEAQGYLVIAAKPDETVNVGEPIAWLTSEFDTAFVIPQKPPVPSSGGERLVSRDARGLMEQHGLTPADFPGSGPLRRVDVERMIESSAANATDRDWPRLIAELHIDPHATVVFGASLQGCVVVDCLHAAGNNATIVFVDDQPKAETVLGHPVFSARCLPQLRARGITRAHVAISTAKAKLACAQKLKDIGFEIVEIRHPTASISAFAKIGEGCFFGPLTLVGPEAEIGDFVQINNSASVAHHTRVGDAVRISDGVRLAGRVSVGPRAFIGLGVTVNEKIMIGADTTIVSGVHIFNHVADNVTVRTDGKAYPNRKA